MVFGLNQADSNNWEKEIIIPGRGMLENSEASNEAVDPIKKPTSERSWAAFKEL
jgi:hypothetical protein